MSVILGRMSSLTVAKAVLLLLATTSFSGLWSEETVAKSSEPHYLQSNWLSRTRVYSSNSPSNYAWRRAFERVPAPNNNNLLEMYPMLRTLPGMDTDFIQTTMDIYDKYYIRDITILDLGKFGTFKLNVRDYTLQREFLKFQLQFSQFNKKSSKEDQ